MSKYLKEIILLVGVSSVLFVLSFSFPFTLLPDFGGWLEPVFNQLVRLEGITPYHSGEDSLGMIYNTINVFVLSYLIYIPLTKLLKQEVQEKWCDFTLFWLRYFLAIMLLIYGFDKVYKWQFYAPESNVLYTQVKNIPHDLLYWTTMGTSYSYSLFAGALEVIAGFLLLFRKTHVAGSLLSIGVLANVLAVNIGFDITMKLFSGFLLLVSLALLLPHLKTVVSFFLGESVQLADRVPFYHTWKSYPVLKALIVIIILVESQYKYFAAGNFNDDLAPRPYFNGVYEIIHPSNSLVRVHFHRDGYLIFESIANDFDDYQLSIDFSTHEMKLTGYDASEQILTFKESGDTLSLWKSDGSFSLTTVKRAH